MIYQTFYSSPLGFLQITGTDTVITGVDFVENSGEGMKELSLVMLQCIQELDEYFQGKRTMFTVPLASKGTTFQTNVWKALTTIPYGKTHSYLDIATKVGNPKAVRAVGMTNGRNPIAIIVPCHRVIGKNGKMVGYASGVWRKEWLLQHEQKHRAS